MTATDLTALVNDMARRPLDPAELDRLESAVAVAVQPIFAQLPGGPAATGAAVRETVASLRDHFAGGHPVEPIVDGADYVRQIAEIVCGRPVSSDEARVPTPFARPAAESNVSWGVVPDRRSTRGPLLVLAVVAAVIVAVGLFVALGIAVGDRRSRPETTPPGATPLRSEPADPRGSAATTPPAATVSPRPAPPPASRAVPGASESPRPEDSGGSDVPDDVPPDQAPSEPVEPSESLGETTIPTGEPTSEPSFPAGGNG